MKVRVSYAVEVDDAIRREINEHYGRPGLASREQVKSWYWHFGRSMDDDLRLASGSRDEEEDND